MIIRKVALLTSTFFPSIGGVEVGIHNIALRLLTKGIEPIVIAPYQSKYFKELKNLPYKVYILPPKFFHLYTKLPNFMAKIFYNFAYKYLQEKYNFDIWHITMGYPAGVTFVEYGNQNNIPYLVRCAGSDIQVSDIGDYGDRRNKKVNNLINLKLNLMPCLISISNSVYKEYKKLNINDENITSITNGVDVKLFDNIKKDKDFICKKYNISLDNKIFLSVGRNHPKKNFKLLFKIAKELIENRFYKFTFIIIGDNVNKLNKYMNDEIKDNFLLLESFGIDFENGVPLIPNRELIKFYKASDLFVFPSYIETFGIVLIEAMAAKLPIITTNVEGCKDLIENDLNGYLLDPENSKEFCSKILFLLKNMDIYNKYSYNNYIKAKNYDWDIIVNKYVKTYKKLKSI